MLIIISIYYPYHCPVISSISTDTHAFHCLQNAWDGHVSERCQAVDEDFMLTPPTAQSTMEVQFSVGAVFSRHKDRCFGIYLGAYLLVNVYITVDNHLFFHG